MAILEKAGIRVSVSHCPAIKDDPGISFTEMPGLLIVTVEEHSTVNGLGACLSQYYPVAYRFGLSLFPEGYGSRGEILAKYGLTAENIANKIKELRG